MLVWVNITPLGFPVVPDEYIKNERSFIGSTVGLSKGNGLEMVLKCLKDVRRASSSSPMMKILVSASPIFLATNRTVGSSDVFVNSSFAFESINWNCSSGAV